VIAGKDSLQPPDARRRLARLQRLGRVETVETPAGMRLDIGERLVLGREVFQHRRQKRVLLDVGRVSGVVDVLVGQHARR
jgi:hypothetical protein